MKNIYLVIFIVLPFQMIAQGKVGIGTTNPSQRLQIHQQDLVNDPLSIIQLTNVNTGSSSSDGLNLQLNSNTGSIMNYENGLLNLGTNGVDRISVLANGKIGFNTSNILGLSDITLRSLNPSNFGGMYIESPSATAGRPFYGYATDGTAKVWHYFDAITDSWRVNNGGDRLYLKNTGQFGIGVPEPIQMLEVNGKLKLGTDEVSATSGTIKYANNDFEGFDGTEWKSFTHFPEREDVMHFDEYMDYSLCPNPDIVVIHNNAYDYTDCGVMYDSGGPFGSYSNNEDYTYTVCANFDSISFLKLIVEAVDLESSYDSLKITSSGFEIVYAQAISNPDTIILSSGCFSVQFKSDSSNPGGPYDGFTLKWEYANLSAPLEDPIIGFYFNPEKLSIAAGLNVNDSWEDSLGINAIAIGSGTKANHNSISIGTNALATENGSVAIGQYSRAEEFGSVTIGRQAISNGSLNTAIGFSADTDCSTCTAIGAQASNYTDLSVVIGASYLNNIGGYQNWTNLSDGRFKKDIKENIPGLEFIRDLRPITYKLDFDALHNFWGKANKEEITNSKAVDQIRTGFIAQDVEATATRLGYDFSGVFKPLDEDDHYGLRYAEFVVPLVKAVQELDLQNRELKKQLNSFQSLHAEMVELKQKFEKLSNQIN